MDYIHEITIPAPAPILIPIKKSSSQDNCKELSLNQTFIDPNNMSPPNSFMDKLMKRMDNYYSSSDNEPFYCSNK